jgi:hypothetical protein
MPMLQQPSMDQADDRAQSGANFLSNTGNNYSAAAPQFNVPSANQDVTQFQVPSLGNAPITGQDSSSKPGGGGWQGGLSTVSNIASNYNAAEQKYAIEGYESDLKTWKDTQGMWWFDPNFDVTPTLTQFTSGQPSAKDALASSSVLGKSGGEGGYVGQQVVTDALMGASLGTGINAGWGTLVGGVLGGVVGLVSGIFGWNGAADKDPATAQQAKVEYQQKYQQYLGARAALIDKNKVAAAGTRQKQIVDLMNTMMPKHPTVQFLGA